MNAHDRARDLIAAGSGSDAQRSWLEQHLAECTPCAGFARLAASATTAVRSQAVIAPPAVVHATHLLVRARAAQLQEMQARLRVMWIGISIGVLIGIVTTPLLWLFAAWVGRTYSLSPLAWQAGFVLLWFIPASFAAAVALAVRPQALNSEERR